MNPILTFIIICLAAAILLKILAWIMRSTSALSALDKLRKGETAKLSLAQIANANISLTDAKKNLTAEKFEQLYALYNIYQNQKEMILCTPEEYAIIAAKVVVSFDKIDSFLKYSGEENPTAAQLRLTTAYSLHNEEPQSAAARDFFRFFDC